MRRRKGTGRKERPERRGWVPGEAWGLSGYPGATKFSIGEHMGITSHMDVDVE